MIRVFIICAWLAIALSPLFVTTLGYAQLGAPQLPEVVTLEEFLELSRRYSPELRAERAEIDVVASELIEADILPNPTIEYEAAIHAHGTRVLDGTEHELRIEQPLLVYGQRSLRRQLAQKRLDEAEARLELAAREIVHQARQQFFALMILHEQRKVLRESRNDLDRVRNVVAGRVEAGAESQYDLLRLDVDSADLHLTLSQIQTEIEEQSIKLGGLLGQPHWRPTLSGELDMLWPYEDMEELLTHAREHHPLLQWTKTVQDAARSELALIQRERWPIPTLGLGSLITSDDYSVSLIGGISIDLPIFDRAQGSIARANAEIVAAQHVRDAIELEIRTQLIQSWAVMHARQSTLEEFRGAVITRLPAMLEMAETAYRVGQASILELLDAFEIAREMTLTNLELLGEVIEARLDTQYAAGF